MRIKSNRKVPQTNRLSLGVLDMYAKLNNLYNITQLTKYVNYFAEDQKLH